MLRKHHVESRYGWAKWLALIVLSAAVLALGGCSKKKVAVAPPPPPPPPPAVTASLSATPELIEAGQPSTLTWHTENATDVMIDGVAVEVNGTKAVSPVQSTTYRLNAKGPGGTQEAAARITVMQPPPPPTVPGPSEEELFAQNIKPIYFDYDKYDIRSDQQATVQANAQWLAQHPNVAFTIEGHCDERGSLEYNMALGDNRANAVRAALVQAGVGESRIGAISYGKEKPFCTEAHEGCYQQNRRGHFVYQK